MTRIPIVAELAVLAALALAAAFAAQPAGAGDGFVGAIHGFRPAVRVIGGGFHDLAFRQIRHDGERSRTAAVGFHRRGLIGWGLPIAGGFYGSPYDAADTTAPLAGASSPLDDAGALYQLMALGRRDKVQSCESQTQWVPSSHGLVGVDVTRC